MQLPRPIRRARTGIRLARAVVTAPVDDGLILVDNRRGTLYHLNRTRAVILTALINDGGTTESTIGTLVDRYDLHYDLDETRA